MYGKKKKTGIAKAILRKKKIFLSGERKTELGEIKLPDSKLYNKASHQNSMVLAQKQKGRSMEQDSKSRDKPLHLQSSNPQVTKEARIYNGEKTASSILGAGKTGQFHTKE